MSEVEVCKVLSISTGGCGNEVGHFGESVHDDIYGVKASGPGESGDMV
jgi:hypothetical protein